MQKAAKLLPEQFKIVRVQARENFSADHPISVQSGECYSIIAARNAKWCDSWIKTGPAGYINPLLWLAKARVSGVRCFQLCGTIDQDENNHFAIGEYLENYIVPISGTLYFFANDDLRYYNNNKGHIDIIVARIS